MDRRRSGRGSWGRDFGIFRPRQGQNRGGRLRKAIKPCGTYRDTFPQFFGEEGLQRYRGLWDLQGYWLGSLFRPSSYVRIRICGTYRRLSQLPAPFSNESRIAPHVVGMLLAIATLVVGARSVLCLLPRISAAEVIRVLSPPLLIEPLLLFLTALAPATGLLPLLEPRMGMKPTTTERTPPPREHIFPSSKPVGKETNRGSQEKERKQKGKAIETDLRKKESEGWRTSYILRILAG